MSRWSDFPFGQIQECQEIMKRSLKIVVGFIATISAVVTFAQINSPSSSVALVYVSSSPSSSNYEINAFSTAPDGKLTAVSGSPFAADVQSMAVNGKYLFGTNGVDIYSFAIASDGALENVASINAQKFNGYKCGGPYALFLDHTGTILYDEDFYGNVCANNTYQSFGIDRATGELSYLGASDASVIFGLALSFAGNNVFAYGSDSYQWSPYIFGFKRHSDGTLTDMNINPPMPAAKKGDFYDPYGAATDPANHVAISVRPFNGTTWQPDGPVQLAIYTANNSGNLTTHSTFSNMPTAAVTYVTDMRMSPSAKLLAVGGGAGLQVFHFNGSKPITHYTGLLTKDLVNRVFWDNDNHLYAISQSANKLYVFTVTPTSIKHAPGSPYTITNPQDVTVLPRRGH
jgi:hypothetical protein